MAKRNKSTLPKSRAFSLLAILCSSQETKMDPNKAAKITCPVTHK